jgi:3-hydroxymyristoyl/3-hydroxydecanoyl-(acyl carrier protein) dehydratase
MTAPLLLARAAAAPRAERGLDVRPRSGVPSAFDVHVARELAYFEGHFEHEPILAGVVQIEVLVSPQAASIWPDLGRIRRIAKLRFRSPIRPGDDLLLTLARPEPTRVDFEMRRGTEVCSSGTLLFELPLGG